MARPVQTIPDQALPNDKRRAMPAPFTMTLPSGLAVEWRMPDLFTILSFDGIIPDPVTAAVIKLLKDERSYTPDDDVGKLKQDAASILGMYGLASHMLISPRLNCTIEYGEGETLGRREIAYSDVCSLYWQFRVATRQSTPKPTDTTESRRTPDTPPDRGDLRPDTGATDGSQ